VCFLESTRSPDLPQQHSAQEIKISATHRARRRRPGTKHYIFNI